MSQEIIFYIVVGPFAILAAGISIALWGVAIVTIVELCRAVIYSGERFLRKPVALIIRLAKKNTRES